MIESYISIYEKSDFSGRLDIIKRFLDKMFPLFYTKQIDDYDVIFTRDKYQLYHNKECIASLTCDDVAFATLTIHNESGDTEVRCYDQTLNEIIYELLEIEDAHR